MEPNVQHLTAQLSACIVNVVHCCRFVAAVEETSLKQNCCIYDVLLNKHAHIYDNLDFTVLK